MTGLGDGLGHRQEIIGATNSDSDEQQCMTYRDMNGEEKKIGGYTFFCLCGEPAVVNDLTRCVDHKDKDLSSILRQIEKPKTPQGFTITPRKIFTKNTKPIKSKEKLVKTDHPMTAERERQRKFIKEWIDKPNGV